MLGPLCNRNYGNIGNVRFLALPDAKQKGPTRWRMLEEKREAVIAIGAAVSCELLLMPSSSDRKN